MASPASPLSSHGKAVNIPMDTAEAQHHAARLDVQTFQASLLTAHQLRRRLDDLQLCFDYFATSRREAEHEGQRQTVNVLNFATSGLALFLEPADLDQWATFARVNLWATGHLQQAAALIHPLEVQAMRQAFPLVGNSEWHRQAQQDGQGEQAAQLAAWWAVSSLVAGVTQSYEDGEAEDTLEALITSYVAPAPMPLRFN